MSLTDAEKNRLKKVGLTGLKQASNEPQDTLLRKLWSLLRDGEQDEDHPLW
jgi:hypothetical protein